MNELTSNTPASTLPSVQFSIRDEKKRIKKNGSDCRKEIIQSGDRVAVRVTLQAVLAVGIRENECQEEVQF